ncbi:MAG: amidohydrolase family protein [Candidatus Lokiarchaeota archaeon]|nr:amidohydrolase family protein [Candidatus Lokiarchaeota archaeon]
MSKERILADLGPVFDSHEHFGYFDGYSPARPERALKDIINGAYMSAGNVDASDHAGLCKALARFVGSDRFQSFRLGLKALYGDDIYPLSPRVVGQIDQKVRTAHASGDHAFKILKEHMRVSRAILDVPPHVWRAWRDPILGTTIRIDDTACPFVPDHVNGDYRASGMAASEVGGYAAEKGLEIGTLDGFDDALEKYVCSLRGDAVAVKIGTAYRRGVDYAVEENRDGGVRGIYQRLPARGASFTPAEMARWSDYVTTFLLSYAMAEGLPVQVHTGLATMEGTSPLNLVPIMKSFPAVRFFLFHGGYPFHHVLPGVLDVCKNAHADLCWMPILSQQATRELLVELLAMGQADRVVAFGGDCTAPEGSLGALAVLEDILCDVLAGMVAAGKVTHADAVDIGNRVIGENGTSAFR